MLNAHVSWLRSRSCSSCQIKFHYWHSRCPWQINGKTPQNTFFLEKIDSVLVGWWPAPAPVRIGITHLTDKYSQSDSLTEFCFDSWVKYVTSRCHISVCQSDYDCCYYYSTTTSQAPGNLDYDDLLIAIHNSSRQVTKPQESRLSPEFLLSQVKQFGQVRSIRVKSGSRAQEKRAKTRRPTPTSWTVSQSVSSWQWQSLIRLSDHLFSGAVSCPISTPRLKMASSVWRCSTSVIKRWSAASR